MEKLQGDPDSRPGSAIHLSLRCPLPVRHGVTPVSWAAAPKGAWVLDVATLGWEEGSHGP